MVIIIGIGTGREQVRLVRRKNRLDEDDDARTEMISSLSLLSDFKQKSRHHFVQFNRLFDRC